MQLINGAKKALNTKNISSAVVRQEVKMNHLYIYI